MKRTGITTVLQIGSWCTGRWESWMCHQFGCPVVSLQLGR